LTFTFNNKIYSVEEPKWIKDDLVQIEVPSTYFQDTLIATLTLMLNSKNFGSRQLKLENAATILESAWQVATNPITILSDAFDISFINNQDIDEFLSANLEKKVSISDLLNTRCRDRPKEDGFLKDHSNLLHFSAKHGFSKLCQTLLNLGYQKYLSIPNIIGLTPPECAEKSGYHSLAQELRGQIPPNHEYQYPSFNCLEGEDGYLMPSVIPTCNQNLTNQNFENVEDKANMISTSGTAKQTDMQFDKIQDSFEQSSLNSSDFYQVPPAPVPLVPPAPNILQTSLSSDSLSESSGSTPVAKPPADCYLLMEPAPVRKSLSESRSVGSFPISNSSSLSRFKDEASDNSEGHISGAVMSRDELIKTISNQPRSDSPQTKYDDLGNMIPLGTTSATNIPRRPDSTPPNIDYYQNQVSSCPSIDVPSADDSSIYHPEKSTADMSSQGSPYVHTDPQNDGLVYLPIESQDSDSELTSYYEAGMISQESLDSYRNHSVSPESDDACNSKRKNTLTVDNEIGKVKKILGRLSPSRSKFSMGSLKRKTSAKVPHVQVDDNKNIIDSVEHKPKEFSIDDNDDADIVLNLTKSRCTSLKNIATPLPPKLSQHSKTLPSPEKRSYNHVSSSLYDIPRRLSRDHPKHVENMFSTRNNEEYIAPEKLKQNIVILPSDSFRSSKSSARKMSGSLRNSNEGAYENVRIIPVKKE